MTTVRELTNETIQEFLSELGPEGREAVNDMLDDQHGSFMWDNSRQKWAIYSEEGLVALAGITHAFGSILTPPVVWMLPGPVLIKRKTWATRQLLRWLNELQRTLYTSIIAVIVQDEQKLRFAKLLGFTEMSTNEVLGLTYMKRKL